MPNPDTATRPTPILGLLPIQRFRRPPPVVSVVRLEGVIGRLGPLHRGITLAALAPQLEKAFRLRNAKAVALAVNSPGGSPVQSSLIARRIRALAEEKDLPVYAFCEDVAASGGYWLAAAADRIYADPASIVGSVGVVSAGFGFPELLKRIGVERRLHTAGTNKARHDAFLKEKPEDVAHLKDLQADLHGTFKDWVRDRRDGRLQADEETLFQGDFWSGRRALELGLVDGLGDLRAVMRETFGDEVRLRLVGGPQSLWQRLRRPARSGAWADELAAAVEERLLWGRFGL